MDRALDDIIAERAPLRGGGRGSRRDRSYPRDGVKKPSQRPEPTTFTGDWVHDKYEDDDRAASRPRGRVDRYTSGQEPSDRSAKLKVENLHYDITDEELKELFKRIGPVSSLRMIFDRYNRSSGVAYVTYAESRHARIAIDEYDGANARGQPIRLTLVPSDPPSRPSRAGYGNGMASRSLFDRISGPDTRRRRDRTRSPIRHSDVSKPPPDGIDRYVPGQRDGRSPARRRGGPRDGGRRPGARRDARPRKDEEGHSMVQGRPRKTQEELDAEMADYWGDGVGEEAGQKQHSTGLAVETGGIDNGEGTAMGTTVPGDDDIDMIQ